MLILNEQNMIDAGVNDMSKCIDCMKDVFILLDNGDYRMGGPNANEHGIKVTFPDNPTIKDMPHNAPDRRFAAMPAYLGGRFHSFGIKTYGSNPDNRKRGLPRSILMMSLLDVETGVPLSYMSANNLSGMRTGAVVGLGAKYLANENAHVLSVVGPGVIARYAVEAVLTNNLRIDTIQVFGMIKSDAESFCSYFSDNKGINCICLNSIEEVCNNADIVLFTNSNAENFEDNPHVNVEMFKDGAFVVSTSALIADYQSFNDTQSCRIVTDNYKMYEGWGVDKESPTQKNVVSLFGMGIYDAVQSGIMKRKDIIDLGDIICGKEAGRTNDKQIILFAVGGMPIEDVAWATDCYNRAKELGTGTKLSLW